ncbi:MAG TPA: hypothetical protein VLQ91_10985 [Draconibacterium sp.]|nr:hypothetical protein [Draconibacterium sp.]
MNKFNNFWVVAILLFTVLNCKNTNTPVKERPLAVKGVIDLRKWDFQSEGPLLLEGEWEFFWEKLISPSDTNFKLLISDGYYSVPSIWNRDTINNHY